MIKLPVGNMCSMDCAYQYGRNKAYDNKTKELKKKYGYDGRKGTKGTANTAGVKRDKIDVILSHLVRERNNWNCDCCGKNFEHNKQQLHCSHFQKRSKKATRYHPLDCMAHCLSCHRKLESAPGDMAKEYDKTFSPELREKITLLSNQSGKLTSDQIEEIYSHYKKEKARLKQERMDGNQGRIEFTAPDFYQAGLCAAS